MNYEPRSPVFAEPGARAFVRQASLFGRSVGGSRSISLDVTGASQENIGNNRSQGAERVAKPGLSAP